MRVKMFGALAVVTTLFCAGLVSAAAFLPLEQVGRGQASSIFSGPQLAGRVSAEIRF
jgi:hypothetical protein